MNGVIGGTKRIEGGRKDRSRGASRENERGSCSGEPSVLHLPTAVRTPDLMSHSVEARLSLISTKLSSAKKAVTHSTVSFHHFLFAFEAKNRDPYFIVFYVRFTII